MESKNPGADIKIVFTDIDGTLFSHTQGKIPESAIAAIEALREKGIKGLWGTLFYSPAGAYDGGIKRDLSKG